MKSLVTPLLLACFLNTSAQFFDSLSRPGAWFRSDRSLLNPNQWMDVSGHNRHATAFTGEAPALGSLLNYNPALFFDGVDDYLRVPISLEGQTEFTVMTIFQSADTTERGTWGTENGLSRNVMLTTRRVMGPDAITDYYGKNENATVLSAVAQSWEGSQSNSTDAYLALGSSGRSRGDKPFQGAIAEWMLFARRLSFLERLQIETYLALKYGVSMQGRNYLTSEEQVLWNAEQNKVYASRLTGIGRDDAFDLYQKQSHSAHDPGLTISVGPLAISNAENLSVIHPGDFLVWGDNNGSYTLQAGQGKDSVLSLIQRRWLLTVSGNTANQLITEVQVDIAQFPETELDYWLVIDRSGQENFAIDNLEYVLPKSATPDGHVIYQVTWDTDKSGKDNFGFARARNLFGSVNVLENPSCTQMNAGRAAMKIIRGSPPYQYTLSGNQNKILRTGSTSQTSFEQEGLPSGAYVLSLRDATGAEFVRNFELTMPDALAINLGPDQRLQPGSEIELDVESQVPDSIAVIYSWESNFGLQQSASKVTISESGIYKVTVTKQKDGCAFSDEIAISGTEEQKFAVFPTVLGGGEAYNISVSLPEAGSVQIEIYDLKGKVYQTIADDDNSEYHFKAALGNPGLYMVVMRTAQGTQSKKVIVR